MDWIARFRCVEMSHFNHVQLWAEYLNGLDRSTSLLSLDEYETLDPKRMSYRDIVGSNLSFVHIYIFYFSLLVPRIDFCKFIKLNKLHKFIQAFIIL